MTSFEEEKIALTLWYLKVSSEAEATPWEGGLDGRAETERRKRAAQYRQKLAQLKEKYGIKELISPAKAKVH